MFGLYHQRAPSASPRPKSSHTSAPRWDSEQIAHEPLPPLSPAMTLPDHTSHARPRVSAQSPRRLSVFGGRSRSNTATSVSSSSHKSPASSTTSVEAPSQGSSQDGRTQSTIFPLPEKQEGPSKSFLSRGSHILRRQGSKVSISNSPTMDEGEEARERERSEGLGIFHRSHHRPRHSDMHELLKRSISEPYDFQHVTHTSPGQLPPANNTHMNDLATEFSVIRASQRPNAELKGIKADSLHFRNFSSDDVSTYHASSDLHTRSPLRSPDARRSPTSPNGRSKRMSRSVENFSRPVSRLQKQPSSPSMLAPPRSSSRQAFPPPSPEPTCQNIDAFLGLDAPQTFPENVYLTKEDDERERKASLSHLDLAGVFPDGIAHAVTTDDDTSQYIQPPTPVNPHAYELADVPEEDESAAWRNSYVANAGLTSPGSNSSFRHARSNSRFGFNRPLPIASLAANKLSAGLEALGSPTIPADRPEPEKYIEKPPRTLTKRQSVALRQVAEDTWEDDIDYCYEHAAESNCDFDWQRTSIDDPTDRQKFSSLTLSDNSQDTDDAPEQTVSPQVTSSHEQTSDRSMTATPESASLNLIMPNTTPYGGQSKPMQQTVYVKPEHGALLGPQFDDNIAQENMYDGLIHSVQDSDGHYFYPQPEDHIESSRGSCSPLSKCNSQESIILSRAASIARKHRSSLSTTNVPELVPSANGSCETVDRDAASPSGEQAQSSPVHRRSKSLARDASRNLPSIKVPAFEISGAERSDTPNTPTHDRSKSASVLEMQDSAGSMKPVATRQRSSTVTRGMSGRRARKSYSLFPNPVSPPPPSR